MELAVEEATREYDTSKGDQLYMYNPVGGDPIPIEDLESTLESAGAARLEAGHYILLFILTKGKETWGAIIDNDIGKR